MTIAESMTPEGFGRFVIRELRKYESTLSHVPQRYFRFGLIPLNLRYGPQLCEKEGVCIVNDGFEGFSFSGPHADRIIFGAEWPVGGLQRTNSFNLEEVVSEAVPFGAIVYNRACYTGSGNPMGCVKLTCNLRTGRLHKIEHEGSWERIKRALELKNIRTTEDAREYLEGGYGRTLSPERLENTPIEEGVRDYLAALYETELAWRNPHRQKHPERV